MTKIGYELSGFEIANKILLSKELKKVKVVKDEVSKNCYNSDEKIIRLGESIYSGKTLLAYAVAAHEASHAVQDNENHNLYMVNKKILPFYNPCFYLCIIFFFISFINPIFIFFTEVSFILTVFIGLVTFFMEINCSNGACRLINKILVLNKEERFIIRSYLYLAGSTYLFAVLLIFLKIIVVILKILKGEMIN